MSGNVSLFSRVSRVMFQQCARSSGASVPPVVGIRKCEQQLKGTVFCDSSPPRKSCHTVASRSAGRTTCRSKFNFKLNNITDHRVSPSLFVGLGSSRRAYTQAASTLTREQLHDLVYRLNEDERELLMNTLKQFESNKQKAQFEAATVPAPPPRDLFQLGLVNALPFIGFGFLDNFTMIIAGDYIEHTLGMFMCLSTMAAAALGNTISDVIGIGSAFYVEKLAEMSGVNPPKLSPIQLEMKSSRQAANMGRVIGITIGCLLGMCPLLFRSDDEKDGKSKEDKTEKISETTDAAK
ncbi:transmembrane protein 65 isoform X2 [Wyeomyia smithii]|uniref:transmembrane protein 65 isoform X2 n=1 Tax=Wyeomyia smithii TaxID=174621 RepID=UPI002467DB02|nr:transmembrane protein 65 isoform X2 [Wyeomyia smithii]